MIKLCVLHARKTCQIHPTYIQNLRERSLRQRLSVVALDSQDHTTPHHTKPNHTTPHNIRPNQTTPLQTRPRQIRLDYTRQDHTRQDHTTPHHIRPDQTKPDLARSDYTTPNNTKPDQPRSYIRDQVIINLTLVLIYPNILYVVEKEIYISGITSIASV